MAATRNRGVSRVVIGVDPHKRIDAVVVLDEAEAVLARETIEHTSSGFGTLMALARRFPRRTWAVEGCNGVGNNLALRLVAGGETVLDVSTRKSSLVRALATNSGRKTDDTDAYSIALVGLRTEDLPVVVRDERAEVLRLLSASPGAGRVAHPGGLPAAPGAGDPDPRRRVPPVDRQPSPGAAGRDPPHG
jgi:hypothetical protein